MDTFHAPPGSTWRCETWHRLYAAAAAVCVCSEITQMLIEVHRCGHLFVAEWWQNGQNGSSVMYDVCCMFLSLFHPFGLVCLVFSSTQPAISRSPCPMSWVPSTTCSGIRPWVSGKLLEAILFVKYVVQLKLKWSWIELNLLQSNGILNLGYITHKPSNNVMWNRESSGLKTTRIGDEDVRDIIVKKVCRRRSQRGINNKKMNPSVCSVCVSAEESVCSPAD